jgi:hypothetical protein
MSRRAAVKGNKKHHQFLSVGVIERTMPEGYTKIYSGDGPLLPPSPKKVNAYAIISWTSLEVLRG